MSSGNTGFNQVAAIIVLTAAALCVGTKAARASEPVRKAIVGCVTGGVLISLDGYEIRAMHARTRTAVDLSRHEGKRVRFLGSLLPGDIYLTDGTPKILGKCGPANKR